jgi:hypothetical protein
VRHGVDIDLLDQPVEVFEQSRAVGLRLADNHFSCLSDGGQLDRQRIRREFGLGEECGSQVAVIHYCDFIDRCPGPLTLRMFSPTPRITSFSVFAFLSLFD